MSERKKGWYWIKVISQGEWRADYYDGERWESAVREGCHDMEPGIVDSRIPTPDEPWKCVPIRPTSRMVIHAFVGSTQNGVLNELDVVKKAIDAAPEP